MGKAGLVEEMRSVVLCMLTLRHQLNVCMKKAGRWSNTQEAAIKVMFLVTNLDELILSSVEWSGLPASIK